MGRTGMRGRGALPRWGPNHHIYVIITSFSGRGLCLPQLLLWHLVQSVLRYQKVMCGYMDDPANTDQAWKEVELWHFHFVSSDIMREKMKAVSTTEMWICTHGINIYITKMIGDAFKEELIHQQNLQCERHPAHQMTLPQMTLLGICREDLLSYADKLNGDEFQVCLENEGNSPEENKFNLNPYHSHFIVVQDNTVRKAEINSFLLKLEKSLSRRRSQKNGDSSRYAEPSLGMITEVPVIAVLVQGGVSSAQLILSHLQQQLPVIAIKGSGGLADLPAYTYYEVNRRPQRINDTEYMEHTLKPAFSNKIGNVLPYLQYNKVSRNLFCKNILECIKYSVQEKTQYLMILNIYDRDYDLEELPVHLLRALFKSQKTDAENWRLQMQKDLLLTVDWNCPIVALTEIFQKDSSRNLQVANITRQFIDLDLNWLIKELTDMPSFISSQQLHQNSSGQYDGTCFQHKHNYKDDALSVELRAITILIMWAVLSNRGTLAKTLWKHSYQPMNTALICSLMIQKLQPYIHDSTQQKEIEQLSADFAEMATGVLDACYNDILCKAYDTLKEGHPEWGNHSSLEIAALAKNTTFMSHICCQKYLNNMFMGNIRICDLTWGIFSLPESVKILLSALLIFAMYMWMRFKVSVHGDEIKDFGAYEVAEQESLFEEPVVLSKHSLEVEDSVSEDYGSIEALRLQPSKAKIVYPPMWLMIFWMWSAPVAKFYLSQVFYMIFLALFSLDVLWPSCGNKYLDVATFTWGLLVTLEDIRRVYILHKKYVKMPLFLKSAEIMFVLAYLFLFMYGRILGYGTFSDPYSGKVLLCLGLLYMFYRTIFIYLPISSTVGPLLFRIKRLVWFDFMNFMRMTLLVLISNGIILQAALYPDYPITPELFRRAFHRAWISLFLTPLNDITTIPQCVAWFRKPVNTTFCEAGTWFCKERTLLLHNSKALQESSESQILGKLY